MKRTAIAIAVGALCAGISGGVLAQQQQGQQRFVEADKDQDGFLSQEEARSVSNLDQNAFSQADSDGDARLTLDEFLVVVEKQGGQQKQQNQQKKGEGAQVSVDEKSADVDVKTEAPDVTVEKQKPDVTVKQPKPEVKVNQPKPEVTVDQAKPDVSVKQQGKPEVEIKEAGKSEVKVKRPEDQKNQQQGQQQNQQQQNQSGSNTLMSMQVGDLEGRQVVNNNGQEIGEIEHVAKHTQNGKLYGVVTVGGFWGIGGDEIALPLDEMQLNNDQLVMQTNRGKDEIKQSAQEYNEGDYQELENGQSLKEATQSGGGGASQG